MLEVNVDTGSYIYQHVFLTGFFLEIQGCGFYGHGRKLVYLLAIINL